jgi:hypothetical protein
VRGEIGIWLLVARISPTYLDERYQHQLFTLNAMAKRLRLNVAVRRGSTLAMLILFVQAFQIDLAAVLLGASAVAVAFHISHSTTLSLNDDIRALVAEFDDVQRALEAKRSLESHLRGARKNEDIEDAVKGGEWRHKPSIPINSHFPRPPRSLIGRL